MQAIKRQNENNTAVWDDLFMSTLEAHWRNPSLGPIMLEGSSHAGIRSCLHEMITCIHTSSFVSGFGLRIIRHTVASHDVQSTREWASSLMSDLAPLSGNFQPRRPADALDLHEYLEINLAYAAKQLSADLAQPAGFLLVLEDCDQLEDMSCLPALLACLGQHARVVLTTRHYPKVKPVLEGYLMQGARPIRITPEESGRVMGVTSKRSPKGLECAAYLAVSRAGLTPLQLTRLLGEAQVEAISSALAILKDGIVKTGARWRLICRDLASEALSHTGEEHARLALLNLTHKDTHPDAIAESLHQTRQLARMFGENEVRQRYLYRFSRSLGLHLHHPTLLLRCLGDLAPADWEWLKQAWATQWRSLSPTALATEGMRLHAALSFLRDAGGCNEALLAIATDLLDILEATQAPLALICDVQLLVAKLHELCKPTSCYGSLLLWQVITTRQGLYGNSARPTLEAIDALIPILIRQDQRDDALELAEAAFQWSLHAQGVHHQDTLRRQGALASVLMAAENTKAALPHWQALFHFYQKTLGADHLDTLASMGHLASALVDTEAWQSAQYLLEERFRLCCDRFGIDNGQTLRAMSDLADHFTRTGDLEPAQALREKLLAIQERRLGPHHHLTTLERQELAWIFLWKSEYDEAIRLQESSLRLAWERWGPCHQDTVKALLALIDTLAQSHQSNATTRIRQHLHAFLDAAELQKPALPRLGREWIDSLCDEMTQVTSCDYSKGELSELLAQYY